MSGSIPYSSPSRPGYQRQVGEQVNPLLQGYVWPRYESAPQGSLSLSYFDLTKSKPGWYNGSAWEYALEEDASGNVTVSGSLTVNGATALKNTGIIGTLSVSAAVTFSSTLQAGNTTISGTLGVSGATTLAALTASGTTSIGGGRLTVDTTRVTATVPVRLPSYTVASLPSASTHVRSLVFVSDGASSKRLAVSDGTNWLWPDGTVVS
jgi:hypothetical protein